MQERINKIAKIKKEEESMKDKKGISLIVLVITIIVMIVLAGTIIFTLNNSGMIGKANEAVDISNKQEIYNFTQMLWAEEYLESDGKINAGALEEKIKQELQGIGVNTDDYLIRVTESGVQMDEFDRDNWEFAYTYTRDTDVWSSKLTKEATDLTGDIIVKFYKTGKRVNPPEEAISSFLGKPVTLDEDDAYRMLIEGTGNMGILLMPDMTIANAWQYETLLFAGGYADTCIIPYVTEVVIEEGITNIGLSAFAGASSLTTVYNGKGVEEMEQAAFMLCETLDSITIPSSVKKIAESVFFGCNKLTNIHVESLEAWNNTIISRTPDNWNLVDTKVTYDYRTEVERIANEGWQKAYSSGSKTASQLQTAVDTYLQSNNINAQELALYDIKATTKGVDITAKETTLGNIITNGADYGKTVNYSANGVNIWKVLYKQTVDGEEYVYLIASENIPNSSMPTNIPNAKFSGKNIYWDWDKEPKEQANIERADLWLANWGDYSTNPNGRVASHFLSEQYWGAFKNSKYGTNVVGAIGTPTAEMLTASYNERSAAIGDTGTGSTLTLSKETNGYKINNAYWVNLSRLDKLYIGSPASEEDTWLAAPSDNNAYILMYLSYYGGVNGGDYNNTGLGLRPLVCLKSSIPAYVGLTANGTDIILK